MMPAGVTGSMTSCSWLCPGGEVTQHGGQLLHFPGDDQERAMALSAERVLPVLRPRFG